MKFKILIFVFNSAIIFLVSYLSQNLYLNSILALLLFFLSIGIMNFWLNNKIPGNEAIVPGFFSMGITLFYVFLTFATSGANTENENILKNKLFDLNADINKLEEYHKKGFKFLRFENNFFPAKEIARAHEYTYGSGKSSSIKRIVYIPITDTKDNKLIKLVYIDPGSNIKDLPDYKFIQGKLDTYSRKAIQFGTSAPKEFQGLEYLLNRAPGYTFHDTIYFLNDSDDLDSKSFTFDSVYQYPIGMVGLLTLFSLIKRRKSTPDLNNVN